LQSIANPGAQVKPLATGELVPDFEFTDQNQQRVAISQFAGEVVVVTFIYTRCPNPNYCFRLNNNLGRLQKRFPQRLGHDLVLLSIVVDPEHDQGKTLSDYASIWHANPRGWHFLTGPLPEIQKVTRMFGMDFWNGEGVVTHSFHTIVVDQCRKLAATSRETSSARNNWVTWWKRCYRKRTRSAPFPAEFSAPAIAPVQRVASAVIIAKVQFFQDAGGGA